MISLSNITEEMIAELPYEDKEITSLICKYEIKINDSTFIQIRRYVGIDTAIVFGSISGVEWVIKNFDDVKAVFQHMSEIKKLLKYANTVKSFR